MPQVGFHLLRHFETHDDALLLRRYVPHSRFVSLIETSALYFAPASTFSDKKEGHYTDLDDDASDRQLAGWALDARARAIAADARSTVARGNQRAIVISCWTASADESPRMWSEYGRGPEAVALETTVGRLRGALGSAFLIVPVTYLNFSRDTIPREHSIQPFFFKQSSFVWEREVRVVTEMEVGKCIETPRLASVDLASLFQQIIVSPNAPRGYRGTVEALLTAASIDIPIRDSSLS